MHRKHPCPHCGNTRSWPVRERGRKCRACRREWTERAAHPVAGFRLSAKEWRAALDTFLRDGTGTALAREDGIELKRAYRIVRRIQEAMAGDVPKDFSGTVEADATFLGGVWKNKRIHIRKRGTKRGRGTSKQAIFGLAQRAPNLVRVFFVRAESRKETKPHITAVVSKGSRICSDECGAYLKLEKLGYTHESVNHSKGEYVRGDVHTQTLDGFWGLLKNFLADKGGVRRGKLHHFVAEYVWRYNHRDLTRAQQVERLFALLKEE